MACFYAAAMQPAEKAALEDRGKAKMKSDGEVMAAEIAEQVKADTARRQAHQSERQKKLEVALKAKVKTMNAAAANPEAEDDGPAEPGAKKEGSKSRTVSGFGHGPNRDLTCTQAKLSAVSRAGCSGLPASQSGDCSCSQAFKQWTCNVTMTISCK